MAMGNIILFYKYVYLEYPKQIQKWQEELCSRLGLKGRIILAHEGINATLGGSTDAIESYKKTMNEHPLFGGIDFKESEGAADHFPRMRILVKAEIVHLGLDTNAIKAEDGGVHLSPTQAHTLMEKKSDDLVIIDCRNNYETAIGTFDNAIRPNTDYFREFPAYVDEHSELFKDKTVLMACTGGIRCERASAYVKSKGVAKEVYQIEGGIHRYVEEFPQGFFKGKNYVFDGRIAVKVNDAILSSCFICQTACNDYENCSNALCNRQFIVCQPCINRYEKCCSTECQSLLKEGKAHMRPAHLTVAVEKKAQSS